jgi:hypothetical protein
VPARGVDWIFSRCAVSLCIPFKFRFLFASWCALVALLPWAAGLPARALESTAGHSSDEFQRTVRRSGVIFDGTVTAIQCEFGKDKFPRTYRVSFRVKQGVRGVRSGSSFAIREWAGSWAAGGAPRYRVGERALLFLYSPSYAGLTSTVGGRRGKLAVVGDAIQGSQVLLPLEWKGSVGRPPAVSPQVASLPFLASKGSAPKGLAGEPMRVPLAWLVQRIAQAAAVPRGGN